MCDWNPLGTFAKGTYKYQFVQLTTAPLEEDQHGPHPINFAVGLMV
jgi:hypothetical protein